VIECFGRYADVLDGADMIDQSSVRGCIILKPWSMEIWDIIRSRLDKLIKQSGAKNVYFPLLIPASLISMEAAHIDGFAKECAVVTHHRLRAKESNPLDPQSNIRPKLIPDPSSKLEDPLVIRPTSEAAIWTTFRKWITSHRDLPLKINQWANVMRWEMRPRPFLRNSEFLWQEGHTAHATKSEAIDTAKEMIDMYSDVCKVECCLLPYLPRE
jgi:prolyl-tRNA synthetase